MFTKQELIRLQKLVDKDLEYQFNVVRCSRDVYDSLEELLFKINRLIKSTES